MVQVGVVVMFRNTVNTVYTALDKIVYPHNIFLISQKKHKYMLWILIQVPQ